MSMDKTEKHSRESTDDVEEDFEEKGEKGEMTEDERIRQGIRLKQLGVGEIENARFRHKWWQLWLPRDPPPPPRTSLDDAPVIPIVNASIISKLTYSWITEMMVLGYQRTLQVPDLWKMDESREAATLSEKLASSWERRTQEANEWNVKLENGEIHPSFWTRTVWTFEAMVPHKGESSNMFKRRKEIKARWYTETGKKKPSLSWSLNDTFGMHFWLGGMFKVFGDTTQLMAPLVVKTIINYGKEVAAFNAGNGPKPSLGRGIGMAIGLFCLTVTASVCQHQFYWRSMSTGVLARAALISAIYKRGIKLTPKARSKFTNATLVNFISTDVSRIDACAQWFHAAWTAPIQVLICLTILLVQLGPSALAGFTLFALMIPLQERLMAMSLNIRRESVIFTDARAKLILEILGAMRVVKYFSYEIPFLKRIAEIRKKEMRGVRTIAFSRSANLAMAFSVPVLAATLAFVTYTLTAHSFDVAVIFASFSLFQLLRQPLMLLPRALAAITDATNAVERLEEVFQAEIFTQQTLKIDRDLDVAIRVEGATFEWEESLENENLEGKKGSANVKGKQKRLDEAQAQAPFRVGEIDMVVPRGQLVAIVGPVGCGKSSLLQGLIGEMRCVEGSVAFGGRIGYCPQSAWIQNATLKDNILFGQPYDEDRYWEAIENSSLLPDLQVLPDGDLTEIGEKGINLSGGQKQRVNIARALYYNADIVIFDDPLSAVDAHVGKALFTDAIHGALRDQGKTVILVTHALHFLSQCDYIYTLDNGRIAEEGTYSELIVKKGKFARLDKEFGGEQERAKQQEEADAEVEAQAGGPKNVGAVTVEAVKEKSKKRDIGKGAGQGRLEGRLMQAESRTTGSVSWSIYGSYIAAGKGYATAPLLVAAMILMQTSSVLNSYMLVWWENNTFDRGPSFYQTLYGGLGVGQAIFTFALCACVDVMSEFVSRNLHHASIRNIFYAPMSFFDTTPLGRILSIFGKDIDVIDNQLSFSMRMLVLTLSSVIGSIIIIAIVVPYFLIAVFFILVGYNYFALFYRSSAREMKRLDSLLRSLLYSHFSESLTGLATIRSYGEADRFLKDNQFYVDLEDRALFLTITNQRWLAIRLDFLGGLMTFIIAIFAVVGVSGINPAEIGLILTYTTSLTQSCGMVTRQSAEVENYMNSVERVVQYSRGDFVEPEAPHEIEDKKPEESWPQKGAVEFNNITMAYRPGLPNVLKGISLKVGGGEKIGVVGRTGAGKSSLMLALFRIVELNAGSITVDGIDISKIGLRDLRTHISIIPQDPLLFSGTIRSNLDPFNLYDDARLWDALRRAYLVDIRDEDQDEKDPRPSISKYEEETVIEDEDEGFESGAATPVNRFSLDTIIESEGANLSVGERSLLSLARALVKDAKVVVLDEATASVDLETDSKIQYTIQTEFKEQTLLCIAHRLRTILSYDRILVLEAGQVAEFDTPANLYLKQNGIFRGMCERSNITLDEIEKSSARLNMMAA